MRALLDVNVLVALLDATHVHHRVASDWLARHLRSGWASCPMTQNGCLRILSLPSYPNSQPPAIVAERGHALAMPVMPSGLMLSACLSVAACVGIACWVRVRSPTLTCLRWPPSRADGWSRSIVASRSMR